ncbi:Bardet-Biedl syndrome 4 [Arctopsyche grandis]|uniref:Bardet-Biedl syndrome 4 n=1 Tax=Arctopsyche grandis TaxID=121162 RepID=UPI00406D6AD9
MDSGQAIHQSLSNGLHYSTSSRRSSTIKDSVALAPMESQNWLMHMYYTRGQTDKAKLIIQAELDRSRNRNEYAHFLLGTIYCDENKLNESLEEFQACNLLNPSNIENIKQIGICLFRQKRYKLALDAFMEAENMSKRLDWEIHYWIAECLACLGGREAALQWSRRAARAGKQLKACRQLGKLLMHKEDLAGAVEAYNVALESAPDNVDLLTSLGLLHARLGQQQLAVERLGSALALGPPQAAALLPLAAIIQSHGDYDVALSRYKIAAQQTPDCAALWNNIGMCFFGKQKLVAAISCLKRATALSPSSTKVLHNLGLVHLVSHQYASAFQFLCAALNLKSDCGATFMLMAVTLSHLEDYANSVKAFEKSIALAPDDITIRLNYVNFFVSQNETDLAKYHLNVAEDLAKKIQNLDKEHVDAIVRTRDIINSRIGPKTSNASRSDNEPIYQTIDEAMATSKSADDVEDGDRTTPQLDPDEV